MHRRPAPLLTPLLALAGCFVDVGSASGPTTTATASSGADTGSTAEPSTAAPPLTGDVTDGTAATTGDASDGPGTAVDDPSTTTADPDTSGGPSPICGDGVVDEGEACDDGNRSDADACLADCTLPSCADGHKNQDETDVDCGGSCTACGYCQLCLGDPDCAAGFFCDGERCSTGTFVAVDASAHCGVDPTFWTLGPDLPLGTYRITAEGGGATVGDEFDYGWVAACVGLDFGMMYVDYVYPTAADAFASLPVTEVNSYYGGGPLRCGVFDDPCDDNFGALKFSLTLLCD